MPVGPLCPEDSNLYEFEGVNYTVPRLLVWGPTSALSVSEDLQTGKKLAKKTQILSFFGPLISPRHVGFRVPPPPLLPRVDYFLAQSCPFPEGPNGSLILAPPI